MQSDGRIFYGWWVVATCFVVNFIVFGISVNTFTVYMKPIAADLGWSRGQISLALTLAALAMGAGAPFVGRLIDRTGARAAMAAGATVVGVTTVLLASAHSLGFFYAVFIVSGIGQGGATVIPISLVIANWFEAQRAKALGIAMTGTGLGMMVMVPVTSWIVSNWGWRSSFRIMGGVILATVPLTLLLIRTRPADMNLLPDGDGGSAGAPPAAGGLTLPEAARTPAFWLIGSMMLLIGLVAMGVAVHLMPYLTDIGHPEATAALLISVIAGFTVIGKLGVGYLADRWGIRPAIALAFSLIAIGVLLLMGAGSFAAACGFAVVWGLAIGTPLLLNPALAAECVGLRSFGAVFGALTLLNTAGVAAGAVISGVIYDSAGTYFPAFVLFIALTVVAGSCGVLARRSF
jgi:predicted MFS family arabinose efflux permease